MFGLSARLGSMLAVVAVGVVLAGCGSKVINHAPVEDRGTATGRPVASAAETPSAAIKQLPGYENAGKPGYYTVKPGDTLIRIGLDSGQSAKDIARWSALENANRIEVGQVLRVVPPTATAPAIGAVAGATASAASKPVTVASATPVATPSVIPGSLDKPAAAASAPASAAMASVAVPAPVPAPPASAAVATGDDDINWIWPTSGAVIAGFDEVKNKGLDISGNAGDPVLAAADGRVVYVGAGLRGYGNLIILKHNNTYLTAYAHNKTLLIKEDQSVRKGQKIAEMGNSDADRVKLHFEVRRQGKPVDPAKYLPAR
jgi:lipoprotein NlpD